ncbi:hypothetical protein CEUSTIGMA_g6338.t1 [Chlamydomonas eustigma]|uniref:Uncharacterized protein n=1 Tax=Chlamydomonas eustigma TaxID=1157962 RepID=A0A250X7K5_9CHLO|nr:hypothetical protein CEUSTIGMA_g6338.t1 [Chlamydomonas eustigma]|eukprot:GAX78899.1 hypothetical protein CEUSTIGMA_g6338.t1 [Chlamydomonas eustigma]
MSSLTDEELARKLHEELNAPSRRNTRKPMQLIESKLKPKEIPNKPEGQGKKGIPVGKGSAGASVSCAKGTTSQTRGQSSNGPKGMKSTSATVSATPKPSPAAELVRRVSGDSNTSSAISNAQNNHTCAPGGSNNDVQPSNHSDNNNHNEGVCTEDGMEGKAPVSAAVERKRSSGHMQLCRELQGLHGGLMESPSGDTPQRLLRDRTATPKSPSLPRSQKAKPRADSEIQESMGLGDPTSSVPSPVARQKADKQNILKGSSTTLNTQILQGRSASAPLLLPVPNKGDKTGRSNQLNHQSSSRVRGMLSVPTVAVSAAAEKLPAAATAVSSKRRSASNRRRDIEVASCSEDSSREEEEASVCEEGVLEEGEEVDGIDDDEEQLLLSLAASEGKGGGAARLVGDESSGKDFGAFNAVGDPDMDLEVAGDLVALRSSLQTFGGTSVPGYMTRPCFKIPRLPMIRFGRRWYRGNVLLEQSGKEVEEASARLADLDPAGDAADPPSPSALISGRVQLECPGLEEAESPFWMSRDSDRLWRGSYKNRDWKYLGDGAWEPKGNCKNRPFHSPGSSASCHEAGAAVVAADRRGRVRDDDSCAEEEVKEEAASQSEEEVEDGQEEEAQWVARQRRRGRQAPRRNMVEEEEEHDEEAEEAAAGSRRRQRVGVNKRRGAGRRPTRHDEDAEHLDDEDAEVAAWMSTTLPAKQKKSQRSASAKVTALEAGSLDDVLHGLDSLASLNGEDGMNSDVGAAALLASLSWLPAAQPPSGTCLVPLSLVPPSPSHRRKGKPQRARVEGDAMDEEENLALNRKASTRDLVGQCEDQAEVEEDDDEIAVVKSEDEESMEEAAIVEAKPKRGRQKGGSRHIAAAEQVRGMGGRKRRVSQDVEDAGGSSELVQQDGGHYPGCSTRNNHGEEHGGKQRRKKRGCQTHSLYGEEEEEEEENLGRRVGGKVGNQRKNKRRSGGSGPTLHQEFEYGELAEEETEYGALPPSWDSVAAAGAVKKKQGCGSAANCGGLLLDPYPGAWNLDGEALLKGGVDWTAACAGELWMEAGGFQWWTGTGSAGDRPGSHFGVPSLGASSLVGGALLRALVDAVGDMQCDEQQPIMQQIAWRAKLELELGMRELVSKELSYEAAVSAATQALIPTLTAAGVATGRWNASNSVIKGEENGSGAGMDAAHPGISAAAPQELKLAAASVAAVEALPAPLPGAAPPLLLTSRASISPALLACLPSPVVVKQLRSMTSCTGGCYCPTATALLSAPPPVIPSHHHQQQGGGSSSGTNWQLEEAPWHMGCVDAMTCKSVAVEMATGIQMPTFHLFK